MLKWWWEWWPVGAAFSLVVLYRMLAIFIQYEVINVWDTGSVSTHLPMMFLYMDFFFEKRICLVSMDLLYIRFTYYTQRSVSNWATDTPCGVWGRSWTTCLPRGDPILGLGFQRMVGVYVLHNGEEVSIHMLAFILIVIHYPSFTC